MFSLSPGGGGPGEGLGGWDLQVHKELVQLTFAPQGFIGDWSKARGQKVDL